MTTARAAALLLAVTAAADRPADLTGWQLKAAGKFDRSELK